MSKNPFQKNLSEIIIDDTIYPRSNIDPETITRYLEALEVGATLPPLVVMPDGRLLDGRHRYEAYKRAGKEEVEVIVEEPGDPDERAVELNLCHGRPLTREELRQAARRWYSKKPVTEIAKTLGVTRRTIQNWVADLTADKEEERVEIREKALEMRAEGMTQEEVAERLGVTQQAISKWEYNSEKNFSPLYVKNSNNKPMEDGSVDTGLNERHEEGQESIGNNQENKYPDPITAKNKKETAPVLTAEDREEEKETGPQTGRQAAEAFRKKHLPCSDTVKEFYHQLKKASELAEQLVNRREELIEAIVEMEADGVSITVIANAVVQACDIYLPRIEEAKAVLEEALKRGVKGVVVKDKFMVLKGGKNSGG
ncbi:MAG: helix-turn-helix domain-containing protein [Firmicutes bacterium]|nr:helix-turn-helix domain-containing protein [Bacillota bacterium]